MRNIPGIARGDWAAYIKAIREATQLGTKRLAERAGVSRETWWRWESGRQRPEKAEVAKRFADGFSVDADEVMWAAGLAIEDRNEATAPDPRLRGLDPNDRVVQAIMALDISEDRRTRMLNRRRKILADRERADLEEIEFLVDPGTDAV
jgi:transcriptional regulator with XRE-family HTH domain